MSTNVSVSGEHPSQEAAAPEALNNAISQSEQSAPYEETANQNGQVPLSALQSERNQRQQLQDELRMIKEHLALMQANQQNSQQQPQKNEWDGLDDSDVLTVGEAKKFMDKMNSQYSSTLEELRVAQMYPDYKEVVTKYLPEVLKQNPSLKRSLQKTQDYELAYHLSKNSDFYRRDKESNEMSDDARRIVQNSQQTGNLSSMGMTSPISEARRYKDMPDKEFQKLVSQNMGGI